MEEFARRTELYADDDSEEGFVEFESVQPPGALFVNMENFVGAGSWAQPPWVRPLFHSLSEAAVIIHEVGRIKAVKIETTGRESLEGDRHGAASAVEPEEPGHLDRAAGWEASAVPVSRDRVCDSARIRGEAGKSGQPGGGGVTPARRVQYYKRRGGLFSRPAAWAGGVEPNYFSSDV